MMRLLFNKVAMAAMLVMSVSGAFAQTEVKVLGEGKFLIGGICYEKGEADDILTATSDQTGGLTDVVIPETVKADGMTYMVTAIGKDAFRNSKASLKSVSVPKTVTKISFDAFEDCERLYSVDVAKDNPYYYSAHGIVYAKGKRYNDILLFVPPMFYGPGNGLFMAEAEVGTVASYAFKWTMLKTVMFSPALTTIDRYAFIDCPNLEELHFYGEDVNISPANFINCPKMKALYFRHNGKEKKVTIEKWRKNRK